MKKCTECNKIKPLNKYFKATKTPDGKAYKCKICTIQLRKEWVKRNPEKHKAQIARRKFSKNWPTSESRKAKIALQRKHRKDLTDTYIKQLICSKGTIGENLNPKDISKELIEAYKIQVLLKRALRELKQ